MPGQVTTPGANAKSGTVPVLASNALPIATRINEFEITRVVGEGGFSIVYLAFDHILHRSIALKEYIPSQLASRRGDQTVAVRSAQHQQTFEAGLRSFINEARLLAQFDHPALVKVYRFWEANGTAYMAMPYYEGRTLKDILREHPEQANEAWLKRLLVPLLDALTLLHDHRCFHRDIAPDNIQILDNGEPVLLDFGAARRTIGDMTQAFTVILKPGYAPIEQYAEETDLKQGPWTDLYALSAVLYWAIIGKPPPTAVARVIKDPLEPLAARNLGGFDPAFLSGIDRGLAVRPEARPQSVTAWRKMLGVDERSIARTHRAGLPADVSHKRGERDEQAPPHKTPDVAAAHGGAGGDVAAESDRTIVVPGLQRTRRQPEDATPATSEGIAGSGSGDALTPLPATLPAPDEGARLSASRPQTARLALIVGAVAVVAVVTWLLVARPFTEVPVVAKTDGAASPRDTAQAPQSATPPASSTTQATTPAETRMAAQSKPSPPLAAASPASEPSSMSTPARSRSPGMPDAREAPLNDRSAAPAKTQEAPSPSRSSPPPVPDDERRWAAIRNTNSIDDLTSFRRRFPQSPHAQDAAVRIQQLMRESRENAREAEPAPPGVGASSTTVAKSAPAPSTADPAASAQRAAIPAAANNAPASAASKGTVRIRVQPFGYVYIDGALIGPSPPSREVQLSPGKHRIEARNDQETPPVIQKEVDVTAAGSTEVPLRFRE